MILIASAAYVDQDLAYEFGRIPPAFLSIGNRRLYQYQLDFLSSFNDEIYLSIPESYVIPEYDMRQLSIANVQIVRVPDGLKLGDSIVYSCAATGVQYSNLLLLHGDTLFLNMNTSVGDFITVHPNIGSYHRGVIPISNSSPLSDYVDDERPVLSGLFSFLHPHVFIKELVLAKGDFVKGVKKYGDAYKFAEVGCGEWLDFGHLNSFYSSRSRITTQRSFNFLTVLDRVVIKSSKDNKKMQAEACWFESLPVDLRIYAPILVKELSFVDGVSSYGTEYLFNLPLSDLFVFGSLPNRFWLSIFSSCLQIVNKFKEHKPVNCDVSSMNKIYMEKTLSRISNLDLSFLDGFSLSFSKEFLNNIVLTASKFIRPVSMDMIGVVHGDFCFSNVLYDSRTQALKLIDPRGISASNELSIYGDARYDVAKLYHSVFGGYDFIIAGRYELAPDGLRFFDEDKISQISPLFDEIFFGVLGFDKKEILSINVLLFLSMLPLHSDRPDRQVAMILNAMRIYEVLKDIE